MIAVSSPDLNIPETLFRINLFSLFRQKNRPYGSGTV
jgi:hypothetical protein